MYVHSTEWHHRDSTDGSIIIFVPLFIQSDFIFVCFGFRVRLLTKCYDKHVSFSFSTTTISQIYYRIIVLLIAILGLICGILGAYSCEFSSSSSSGNISSVIRDTLDSLGLSDLADSGTLQFGIFGYEDRSGQCVNYPDGIFSGQVSWFSLVQVSQILVAVSIAFGVLGILLTLMELIVCNFIGSCAFGMFSFFVAWGTMAAAVGTYITSAVGSGFWYVFLFLICNQRSCILLDVIP